MTRKLLITDIVIAILMGFLIMALYIFELIFWGRYVFLLSTIAITLVYAYQNTWRINLKIERFHLYTLIFAVYCILSSLWAWDSAIAFKRGVSILYIFFSFFPLYEYYCSKNNSDMLLKTIMFAGYGIALYTIIYYGPSNLFSMLHSTVRLGNDYTNANSIGMTSALSLVIQLSYLLRKEIDFSIVLIVPAIVVLAASQSRKAMLMLVIGFVLLTVLDKGKKKIPDKILRLLFGVIIFFIMLKIVMTLDAFSGVISRFKTYFESRAGIREEDIRDVYRSIGFAQFLKTPLLGIGINNSLELLASVGQRRTYLHNNYIEMLTCGGIVGFVIYYSIYAYCLASLLKFRKYGNENTNLCLVILILLLVMDYAMVSYYDKQQYIYLMLLSTQSDIAKRQYKHSLNLKYPSYGSLG